MKKIVTFSAMFVLLALVRFSTALDHDGTQPGRGTAQKRSGTAIIMTGAAARIPQEAALLEELYHRGLLKDVVFISGVSSGALNSVILNGILSGKITWEEYRDILFNLKNSDVFIQEDKKLPVNTNPLRQFITKVAERQLGYKTIGELPYTTAISFTHLKAIDLKKEVYRMCSRKINAETDTSLSLVDILMASTSFPIAFPPVRISNATTIPDVEYIDGGVGDDHVPYEALLEFEKYRGEDVERIYFISRKSDSIPEISEELRVLGIDDKGRFDKMGISLDNILKKGMIRRLRDFAEEVPDHIPLSYVWVPDFQKDFLMFSFDNLSEQYELTTRWAKTHDPLPLEKYLSLNSIKRNRK
jgi:predicted acylesterase/phospholipase RssA